MLSDSFLSPEYRSNGIAAYKTAYMFSISVIGIFLQAINKFNFIK